MIDRRKKSRLILLFIFTLVVGEVTGCSTGKWKPTSALASKRRGLFDRLSAQNSMRFKRGKGLPIVRPSSSPQIHLAGLDFHWPLRETIVTSPYGQRGREFHEGVDLKAKSGTLVFAAQKGTVLYANSKIRGYGKMVVIRHKDQIATVYAHNSRLLVRRGESVSQGQQIAVSGSTGHVRGPHLHFEVRNGMAALDPLGVLPRFSRHLGSVELSKARLTASK